MAATASVAGAWLGKLTQVSGRIRFDAYRQYPIMPPAMMANSQRTLVLRCFVHSLKDRNATRATSSVTPVETRR
jgi:hypothetical protein